MYAIPVTSRGITDFCTFVGSTNPCVAKLCTMVSNNPNLLKLLEMASIVGGCTTAAGTLLLFKVDSAAPLRKGEKIAFMHDCCCKGLLSTREDISENDMISSMESNNNVYVNRRITTLNVTLIE